MNSALFSSLSSELGQYWQEVEAQSGREVLAFPSSENDRLGRVLFTNLRKGGFCTHLVTGRRAWNCRAEYFEAARAAARRGLKIERAFLLPNRYLRHDPSLREHVDLDTESGIRTRVLDVADVVGTLALPSHASLDYGVWDDELVCAAVYRTETAASGPAAWRVSVRDEDVRLYLDTAKALKGNATAVPVGATPPCALEEPVVATAPIAKMLAPVLCRIDRESGQSCAGYHGFWQYLRIFKFAPTPEKHAGFIFDALGDLARDGSYQRVLISGAADYCILAHVLRVYRKNNARADVTVVDLCETPLVLCKWYANLVSQTVETRASDILDLKTDRPFDVIFSQSMLSMIRPSMRKDLVSKWRELLRPGGKMILTVGISPELPEDFVRRTQSQKDAFREGIHAAARRWRDFLGIDPDEMAKDARVYSARMAYYPVRSREELVELFESGGFTLDRLNLAEMYSNIDAAYIQSGVEVHRTFAELVASRL